MRRSPRDRRLAADLQGLQQLQADSSIFSFTGTGNPPQSYRLVFEGAGLRLEKERVVISQRHEVVIELGAAYPRLSPNLAWRTPIFHPNISTTGVVCLGGYGTHWVPSLTLTELCHMLWEMIRYQNFDTQSPYNREAAFWAKHQTDFKFPIDGRPLRDRLANSSRTRVNDSVNNSATDSATDSASASQSEPVLIVGELVDSDHQPSRETANPNSTVSQSRPSAFPGEKANSDKIITATVVPSEESGDPAPQPKQAEIFYIE